MKTNLTLLVSLSAVLGVAADVVTNSWIGADGAAWGVDSNWSANHVPTGDEYVIFPDTGSSYSINVDGDYQVGCFYVDYRKQANGEYDMSGGSTTVVDMTLTGSGKVSATGNNTSQHCVRINRRLVMDGPTLDLTGNEVALLLYNGFVVNAASHVYLCKLLLHWNGSYMNIEGGYVNVSGYTSYRASHAIRVEDGSFYSSANLRQTDGSTGTLAFTQNGGESSIRAVVLTAGSRLTMNGGTFKFRGAP